MGRDTDTTRLPDAREDRVIECPVCSNTMTKMEAEGVRVDVCAGGCGGLWFDWFELARVDEAHESPGEKFLDVDRDPTLKVDLSKRIRCPRVHEIMMRHFHSVKRGTLVDECPNAPATGSTPASSRESGPSSPPKRNVNRPPRNTSSSS